MPRLLTALPHCGTGFQPWSSRPREGTVVPTQESMWNAVSGRLVTEPSMCCGGGGGSSLSFHPLGPGHGMNYGLVQGDSSLWGGAGCDSLATALGTGNVNISEAEKLLKPYLNRYPKVSPPFARQPQPASGPGASWPHVCITAGRHLPVLCGAD